MGNNLVYSKTKYNKVKYFFKKDLAKYIWSFIRLVMLLGLSFLILYPLIYRFSMAFMHEADLYDVSVKWIPRRLYWTNFRAAFLAMDYLTSFVNSLLFSVAISLLQLASCTIFGYALARFDYRFKNIIFVMVILTLIVPPQVILIPLFLNFRFFTIFGFLKEPGINLINTFWPFILTGITGMGLRNGLFIYILMQYFKGMPTSLEEAAYVDGAGVFKTFFKVMLPSAGSVLVVVFIFAFVWQWNDVFYTGIFIDQVEMMANNLIGHGYRGLHYQWYGMWPTAQKVFLVDSAATILFIIPLLIFYGFMQRYFIESVERTGLVG